MSEEQEIVSGTIGGVTIKREGVWTVSVTPNGSQYSKNLWTKDKNLVSALSSKVGEHGSFVCNVSHWERDGRTVRSLWIAEGNEARVQPQPIVQSSNGSEAPAVDWDSKERRDYRSRAWAQILGAFSHTIKVEEDPVAVFNRLQPLHRKIYEDVTQSFAYPNDDDIPFD